MKILPMTMDKGQSRGFVIYSTENAGIGIPSEKELSRHSHQDPTINVKKWCIKRSELARENSLWYFLKNKATLNQILKKNKERWNYQRYNDEIWTNINTNCVYDNNLLSVYIARTVALFCLSRAEHSRESKQNNFLLNNILFCFSYQKKPLFVNQLTLVFNSVCINVYIVNKDLLYYFLSAVMHVFFYFSDSMIKCMISPINHKLLFSLYHIVFICVYLFVYVFIF